MTAISIIVPTNRIGGLDILFSSLALQSFRDFELILVDNLFEFRHDIVAEKSKEFNIKTRHIEPIDATISDTNLISSGQYQRSLNSGIVHASGRYVMILCDYTWLSPNCLDYHMDFHSLNGSNVYMGEINYVILPKLHGLLPLKYGWYSIGYDPARPSEEAYKPWLDDSIRLQLLKDWREAYETDLQKGILDQFMWSVFETSLTPDFNFGELVSYGRGKAHVSKGFVPHSYCNLKNDSFDIDDIIELNGFNETMDSCHVYQDSEFAVRLEKLGRRFFMSHTCLVHMFDPHGIAIIRNMEKPESHNLLTYNNMITSNKIRVNDWDLKSLRDNVLAKLDNGKVPI